MILKILYNQQYRRVKLTDISLGKNKEFFIWHFIDTYKNKYVGFTPSKVYFGNKTYLWYSLLLGYFLPASYSVNFHNAIGKECYICIDQKQIARTLVPINSSSNTSASKLVDVTKKSTPVQKNDKVNVVKTEEDNEISEETRLFSS